MNKKYKLFEESGRDNRGTKGVKKNCPEEEGRKPWEGKKKRSKGKRK